MGAKILWVVIAGFLAGVFLRSFVPLGLSFVAFLTLLAVAVLFLSFVLRGNARKVIAVAALLALAGGTLRMDAAAFASDPALEGKLGAEVTLEGFVFDEPDVREASVRVPIRIESGVGVLVIAPAHTAAAYGDIVRVEGTLHAPEAFETGPVREKSPLAAEATPIGGAFSNGAGVGREFNYPAYLAKDGIGYELAFANVEVTGRGSTNSVKAVAILLKQKFLEGLALALPEPFAGLAGGITAGDKRGLGEELGDVFRVVGLTHIIVLSGYNIMIVVLGLGWLLKKLYAPPMWKVLFGIGIAVLFALITGLASASVRAAIMASIALIGQYTGRLYIAARALALVALAMVAWNPFILVYDPGFQLSVIATAGLIAFTPRIARHLKFVTTKGNLREIFATTLAAQFAVLPLLFYQTGQLPLYTLPVNLLVLVAVPWAMLFSAIAALGGLILGPFAVIVAFPAYILLGYVIQVGSIFASLPYASISLPAFSAWWLVPLYTAMVLLTVKYGRAEQGSQAA